MSDLEKNEGFGEEHAALDAENGLSGREEEALLAVEKALGEALEEDAEAESAKGWEEEAPMLMKAPEDAAAPGMAGISGEDGGAEEEAFADLTAGLPGEGEEKSYAIDPEKRTISTASRRERRTLYDAEPVRSIDREELGFMPEVDQITKDALELANAAHSYSKKRHTGRALRGVVTSVETVGEIPVVTVQYGLFRIFIPVTLLTRLGIEGQDPKVVNRRYLRHIGEMRLGSEVDFFVISFDEKQKVAVGNRIEALDAVKSVAFRGRNAVKEGQVIEGRVTFVRNTLMGVEAAGVEAALRPVDCLWFRTDSLIDHFHTGQRLPVKITGIGEDGSVTLSVKEGSRDPRPRYIRQLSRKGIYLGHVTTITTHGLFVKLSAMELECVCPAPTQFAIPPQGSEVAVSIQSIDIEKLRVTGYITFVRSLPED